MSRPLSVYTQEARIISEHRGWEDDYDRAVFANGADLLAAVERYSDGLNWPAWVDTSDDPDDDGPRLTVGFFLPRKGRGYQYPTAAYTPENVQGVRAAILRFWAGRADAGFNRWAHLGESSRA